MDILEESGPDAAAAAAAAAGVTAAPAPAPATPAGAARPVLAAKGACWYCDKSLDSVRRFCCKACAAAYDEEAGFIR